MFGIAAINRMLRRQQEQQEIEYKVEDAGLNVRQLKAASKALRLLKLQDTLGSLQKEDMMDFLFLVGMNPTPDVLDGKLRLLRLHKLETFTWGQLAHVWSMLLRDAANEEQILERAFQFFDKDGNGEIDVSELHTTMSELGNLLTEEEICAFIAIMDVDGNGVIGYQEFLETLRTEVPEFAKQRSTKEEMEQRHAALSSGGALSPGRKWSPRKVTSQTEQQGLAYVLAAGSRNGHRSAAELSYDDGQDAYQTAAEQQPVQEWQALDMDLHQQNSFSDAFTPAALTQENIQLAQQQQQQHQQQQDLNPRRQPVPVLPLASNRQQQQHQDAELTMRFSAASSRAGYGSPHGMQQEESLPGQLPGEGSPQPLSSGASAFR